MIFPFSYRLDLPLQAVPPAGCAAKKPPPLRAGCCRRGEGLGGGSENAAPLGSSAAHWTRIRRAAAGHLAFGCPNSNTMMKCCQLSDECLYGVIKLYHKCEQTLNKF